jgi:hypothetical protein
METRQQHLVAMGQFTLSRPLSTVGWLSPRAAASGSDPLSTPLSSRLSSSEFDDAVLRVALTYELFGLTLALEVQQDTGYRANGLPPPNRVELLVRRTMNFASLGHLGLS